MLLVLIDSISPYIARKTKGYRSIDIASVFHEVALIVLYEEFRVRHVETRYFYEALKHTATGLSREGIEIHV